MKANCFTISLLVALLAGLVASAQKQEGNKQDLSFVLSYTNPEFYVSADSVIKSKNTAKYYSLYSYLYALELKERSLNAEEALLDSLSLYIKKRYIAEKWLKKHAESIVPTYDEVLQFYKAHAVEYTTPAICSYFQIFILKDDVETIQRAKQKVLELAAVKEEEGYLKGDKNSDFSISYERDVKMSPSYALTPVLEGLEKKQFSNPLHLSVFQSKVMYYVVSRTDKAVKPFEEVEKDCYLKARIEKEEMIMQELYQKAMTSFPFPPTVVKD